MRRKLIQNDFNITYLGRLSGISVIHLNSHVSKYTYLFNLKTKLHIHIIMEAEIQLIQFKAITNMVRGLKMEIHYVKDETQSTLFT